MITKENTMDAIEAGLMGYEIDAQDNEYHSGIPELTDAEKEEKVNGWKTGVQAQYSSNRNSSVQVASF
jgi:hypothetical protein